ncbi:RpiB/LacA/LacB family sugar-phosphate isomerase [Candidatus Daviesbacteria bacterium]|nr:RpiB/LacA/LacB family sugar-phosphate isomerase [Candidatus Daviesbacteria bacterium]
MKLVVASDERTKLTDFVVDYLKSKDHQLILKGILGDPSTDRWVEIGKEAAFMVAEGKAERGILFCWSGTGICMAANRVRGARAALCWSGEIARLSRKWDNANILCMALVNTKQDQAQEIIDAFLSGEFNEENFNEAYKLDE